MGSYANKELEIMADLWKNTSLPFEKWGPILKARGYNDRGRTPYAHKIRAWLLDPDAGVALQPTTRLPRDLASVRNRLIQRHWDPTTNQLKTPIDDVAADLSKHCFPVERPGGEAIEPITDVVIYRWIKHLQMQGELGGTIEDERFSILDTTAWKYEWNLSVSTMIR